MRGFLVPSSVPENITNEELELLRARILTARELVGKLGLASFPKSPEGQIVELELLWEKVDKRSQLEVEVIFSFDHLSHTNC
jgi:hypothetical protein